MEYIINGCVVVDSEGLRTVGEHNVEIKITTTPMTLLLLLIKNANKELSREELFFNVWEKYNKRASGSSLAVHLSNLRTHLNLYGIDRGSIKTLYGGGVIFKAEVITPNNDNDNDNDNDKRLSCLLLRGNRFNYGWHGIATFSRVSKIRSG